MAAEWPQHLGAKGPEALPPIETTELIESIESIEREFALISRSIEREFAFYQHELA